MGRVKSSGEMLAPTQFQKRAAKAATVFAAGWEWEPATAWSYLRNDLACFEANCGAAMLGACSIPANKFSRRRTDMKGRDTLAILLSQHARIV